MTTQEERSDLANEPLPICDEDRSIPTRIARMDAAVEDRTLAIKKIEQELVDLAYDKECLLKRAKAVHVVEDAYYKIVEIPIYKKNRVVVDILKRDFKDIYDKVTHNINDKLYQKYQDGVMKMDEFIPQAEVKAVTTDKAVLAKVIPPNTEIEGIEISIVRK